MQFKSHIGIDYSGAKRADSPLPGLQVYRSLGTRIESVASPSKRPKNWSRIAVADYLKGVFEIGEPIVVGIDHGFSFPQSYFRRYRLKSWDAFLSDFVDHWPTNACEKTVDDVRFDPRLGERRKGSNDEFRLTETWTSSAKSVFQFDVQGSVAKSTHAGLPWLAELRDEFPEQLHVWPFDGWKPESGKSVVAEVYPSIFRNRYPRQGRTVDQQDAYSIARWLQACDQSEILSRYFEPTLLDAERKVAEVEGWILGIL